MGSGYVGLRNWFPGINSWALKRLQIRDLATLDSGIGSLESVPRLLNRNSLWWVHMGISLKERQITEERMKVKFEKIANPQAFSVEQFVF
jgi:hypothetical protein